MARAKSGKATAAAAAAAKKKAAKKKTAAPAVRGRSRLVDENFLCNVAEDRASVTSSIEEKTGEHNFVSVLKRYGHPKTASFNCADCQFQCAYDEYLYESSAAEKHKQKQTHQICLECSYHWRGPSLYFVCRSCSSATVDSDDEESSSHHVDIFRVHESTIDRALKVGTKVK